MPGEMLLNIFMLKLFGRVLREISYVELTNLRHFDFCQHFSISLDCVVMCWTCEKNLIKVWCFAFFLYFVVHLFDFKRRGVKCKTGGLVVEDVECNLDLFNVLATESIR
jgi:hypothetical protein